MLCYIYGTDKKRKDDKIGATDGIYTATSSLNAVTYQLVQLILIHGRSASVPRTHYSICGAHTHRKHYQPPAPLNNSRRHFTHTQMSRGKDKEGCARRNRGATAILIETTGHSEF